MTAPASVLTKLSNNLGLSPVETYALTEAKRKFCAWRLVRGCLTTACRPPTVHFWARLDCDQGEYRWRACALLIRQAKGVLVR